MVAVGQSKDRQWVFPLSLASKVLFQHAWRFQPGFYSLNSSVTHPDRTVEVVADLAVVVALVGKKTGVNYQNETKVETTDAVENPDCEASVRVADVRKVAWKA